MRKVLLSIVMASSVLAAVPAAAAPVVWGGRAPAVTQTHQGEMRQQIRFDLQELNARISRSAQRGKISAREAASLRREALAIRDLHARLGRNGVNRQEVRIIEARLDNLERMLRLERQDRNYRRG